MSNACALLHLKGCLDERSEENMNNFSESIFPLKKTKQRRESTYILTDVLALKQKPNKMQPKRRRFSNHLFTG